MTADLNVDIIQVRFQKKCAIDAGYLRLSNMLDAVLRFSTH